jgi:N-acetylglucosaminyldiphosphoundecaprenol N-acetyl-beta-D-mannosaminyltransferase
MDDHVRLGPLTLAPLDTREAVEWVIDATMAGRACIVVTSNIHHLRLAEVDPSFRAVVADAELNVADGWPLVAASRLLPGAGLRERVAGVDLVDSLVSSSAPLRVALLGGPPGAASRLADRVASTHEVVLVDELTKGTWERDEQISELGRRLAEARPNLTLIGVGAPRQELLAERLRSFASGPIICCGAAIEMLAGVRPRAPKVLQAAGLEWAFRTLLEPRRLAPRYARAAFTFTVVLARELMRSRRGRG